MSETTFSYTIKSEYSENESNKKNIELIGEAMKGYNRGKEESSRVAYKFGENSDSITLTSAKTGLVKEFVKGFEKVLGQRHEVTVLESDADNRSISLEPK